MKSLDKNIQNYTEAFQAYGDDTKSCHWDRVQTERYSELTKIADLKHASILDVGCGIGGFYEYIIQKGIVPDKYLGVDLIDGMIETAQKKYPKASFRTVNLLEDKLPGAQYDYGILCGVFNLLDRSDSAVFVRRLLTETWKYCTKGMAFNFISSYVNYEDDSMSYHSPMDIMQFVIENLSSKAEIHHHYYKCDTAVYVYR